MKKTKNQMQPSVFIETYGCQMNKSDSEIVAGILADRGYANAATADDADIILINTCSVRANAEQRALGRASTLAGWKREGEHRKLGIIGCMAQRQGDKLAAENPFLDLVAGPDEYRAIPDMLDRATGRHVAVDFHDDEFYSGIEARRQTRVNAWVTIMRGCNNFCTYCIVPYTRGRERSRPADEIIDELKMLTDQNYQEVTLLGQNVNSYHDGETGFARLLERAARECNIPRIRFLTSHPKDLSDALLDVMAAEENICNHIHLPLQAGADSVLKAMNRRYTQAHYLNLVEKIRQRMPQAGITTDIMTGFPGETEADFLETMKVVETVRYDDAFTYHFSVREGTSAAEMKNQVPKKVRLKRLNRLITLQRAITHEKKMALLGRIETVLPEALSRNNPEEWLARTGSDHTVVFPKGSTKQGELVRVEIVKLEGSTLIGRQSF